MREDPIWPAAGTSSETALYRETCCRDSRGRALHHGRERFASSRVHGYRQLHGASVLPTSQHHMVYQRTKGKQKHYKALPLPGTIL